MTFVDGLMEWMWDTIWEAAYDLMTGLHGLWCLVGLCVMVALLPAAALADLCVWFWSPDKTPRSGK